MKIDDHYKQMARYNLWADELLLQHLRSLSEQEYRRHCGLFFSSIHGTLNHLLLGNSAWYGRLSGERFPFESLAQELCSDRGDLEKSLLAKSREWIAYIDQLPETRFSEILTYNTSKGNEVSLPFGSLVSHAFNHATHHRGQISAVISQLGYSTPEMDLVYFLLVDEN